MMKTDPREQARMAQVDREVKHADYILYRLTKYPNLLPTDPMMPPNEVDDILERLDR
jgi:hypothetical protein